MVTRIEVPFEGETHDPGKVDGVKKARYRNFTLIAALVALFLVLIVISMLSYDWYVADSLGAPWLQDGMWSTVHFGLTGEEWHMGVPGSQTIMLSGYDGIVEDHAYIGVARNFSYVMIAVLLMACAFIYLVGRLEYGLEEGESRWSYFLPSIIGTMTIVVLVGGLMYFLVAFEDALQNDIGDQIDWETAGYGWPVWLAALSILLLLPAITISYASAWRAMDSVNGVDEDM